jgi:gas vesicle protein
LRELFSQEIRMNENDSDLGAFLAGFVIGGLVGAAVALILAPQSGEETRRRIVDMSDDWREAGQERFDQVREIADSYSQRAGATLGEARGRASHLTDQIQEQTRIVLDAGKENVGSIRERIAEGTDGMTVDKDHTDAS